VAPETNSPATKVVAAPATNPPPVVNPPALVKPQPAPTPIIQKTSAPAIATNPPAAPQSNAAVAAAEETSSDTGTQWPLLLGGGLLVAAAGLVIWLVARARRPRGSLITSSLQGDPRRPPRK
jgi:hypothetical protein